MTTGGGGTHETRNRTDWLLLIAALAASLGVLWLASGEPLVVAGFAGGALVLGALGWLLAGRHAPATEREFAEPDWSVTVAAIDRPDSAIAVIDRAGRLTCANRRYEEWFGTGVAPPQLAVDRPSLERLTRASRTAWRDGEGTADLVEGAAGRWTAQAVRAGRADDYLVGASSRSSRPIRWRKCPAMCRASSDARWRCRA